MKRQPGHIKLSNDLGGSKQAVELSDDTYLGAIGLHVLGLGYCDRQRTDGEIPRRALSRSIAPGIDCSHEVAELERVGFWEPKQDGWRIAGYLDWQRSREEIEGASESARNAANTRWRNADGNTDRNGECNAPNQPTIQPSNQPPILVEAAELEPLPGGGSRQPAADFEEWWGTYGRVGDKARAFDLYGWWRTTGRAPADELLTAAVHYRNHCQATACLMKHAATFLAKPSKGRSPVWLEWAAGEEHSAMDVGAASRLNDVLEAGTGGFDLIGGGNDNGTRALECGRSPGAVGGRTDARRGLPSGELEG